jgi:hypothetical protein
MMFYRSTGKPLFDNRDYFVDFRTAVLVAYYTTSVEHKGVIHHQPVDFLEIPCLKTNGVCCPGKFPETGNLGDRAVPGFEPDNDELFVFIRLMDLFFDGRTDLVARFSAISDEVQHNHLSVEVRQPDGVVFQRDECKSGSSIAHTFRGRRRVGQCRSKAQGRYAFFEKKFHWAGHVKMVRQPLFLEQVSLGHL